MNVEDRLVGREKIANIEKKEFGLNSGLLKAIRHGSYLNTADIVETKFTGLLTTGCLVSQKKIKTIWRSIST